MDAPRITALLTIIAASMLWSPAVHAQSRDRGLALSNDKPIQIESDNLEIREQEKRAYFTGNVRVAQGEMNLRASKMTVYYRSGAKSIAAGGADIDRIEVSGNVRLSSATQQATADTGSFDMVSEVLVLNGNPVVLSERGNVFTGCKLTVQMKSGLANLGSCGNRVKILIDPKSNKSN